MSIGVPMHRRKSFEQFDSAPRQIRHMSIDLLPSRFPATYATLVFDLEQDANWKQLLPLTQEPKPKEGQTAAPRAKDLSSVSTAAGLLKIWRSYATVGQLVDALEQQQLWDVADGLLRNLLPEDDDYGTEFARLGSPSDRTGSPPTGRMSRRGSERFCPSDIADSIRMCDWSDAMLAVDGAELIGRGGYGNVYHGHWADRDVAIKVFEKVPNSVMSQLEASAKRACRLRHPNIVSLLGFAEPDKPNVDSLALILEFAPYGDLRRQLDLFASGEAQLPEFHLYTTRLGIAVQVASAIEYLHSLEERALTISNKERPFYFVHKDIKSANVLLSQGWQCKLSDLDFIDVATKGDGTTSLMDQLQRSPAIFGTNGFYPPGDNRLTCAWDVYAFGVTLLEIFTGRLAVSPDTSLPDTQRLLASCLDEGAAGAQPQAGLAVNTERFQQLCSELVQLMVSKDKNKRPQMTWVREQLEEFFDAEA